MFSSKTGFYQADKESQLLLNDDDDEDDEDTCSPIDELVCSSVRADYAKNCSKHVSQT